MIFNRTAGGQKKFRITDKKGRGLPDSAEAGEFVIATTPAAFTVVGTSGRMVPIEIETLLYPYSTQAGDTSWCYYFVMPTEDVTIS